MNKTSLLGIAIMATASFCYAWQLPFRQFASEYGLQSIQIVLWSNVIASALALPFIGFCWRNRPHVAGIMGLGVSRVIAVTGYFQALLTLPPSLAVLFFFSGPLFVLLQTTILRLERANAIQAFGFFLGIGGLALSLDLELQINIHGILWALLGGFGISWEYLSTRLWVKKGQELSATLLSIIASNVFILPVAWFYQQTALPVQFPESWYPLLLMSVLSIMLPTLLLLLAIRLIGANTASIIALSEPLFAIAIAIAFGWDDPSAQTWAGVCLLMFALFLVSRYQISKK